MFEINSSKKIFHANDLEIFNEEIQNSYPYVVRMTQNNGVRGYVIENEDYLNPPNTLSFAQDTFSVYFQEKPYFTGNKVKVLAAKFKALNKSISIFITGVFHKTLETFTWGVGSTVDSISNTIISLPVKDGEIDFDFMENFVRELEADRLEQLEADRLEQLEADRLEQLEAYLTLTGLKDYVLSDAENQAIENFNNGKVQWGEFRIGDLFERLSTKKLDYKAADLPKEAMGNFDLPCLTSSFQNQGLNYYVPKKGATILNNVISLPSNSDVYRGYYQSRDFTILSDAYAINWNKSELNLQSTHYLFAVTCINKVTDLKIYSYKNKLGGWNVVQNKNIVLPIKNGSIDYEYMELLISAIQKIVIKDVVQYADQRIEITKELINKDK